VWPHTRQKNWVNCAVLTDNIAVLTLSFLVVFHTENCAVHSGNPTVSSVYLPTPRWHQLKALHSADEHRMVYSFSNTTSYSTFYAFLSSFQITLWSLWLANSKRQLCFYPPQSHAQEDIQNWQKNLTNLMGNVCCVREHSVQYFMQFFTQLTLRWLMSYIYIYGVHILDVSRSHTTTQHSR
jgi:hypothetical protein